MSEGQPLTLAELHPKMELRGIVRRIELAGAVVDVGAEVDALLHISQIRPGRVKNVGDYLQEGKEITVWVHHVDVGRGQVAVTMIKPPAVSWDELEIGQIRRGKVVRIENFGVFVDIGAERPGLVHISELTSGYVASPGEVVSIGDEVEVQIKGVNRRKSQIDLSMKAVAAQRTTAATEEDKTEELPTAMALALQRALKRDEREVERGSTKRGWRQPDQQQEEILSRTLQRMENK